MKSIKSNIGKGLFYVGATVLLYTFLNSAAFLFANRQGELKEKERGALQLKKELILSQKDYLNNVQNIYDSIRKKNEKPTNLTKSLSEIVNDRLIDVDIELIKNEESINKYKKMSKGAYACSLFRLIM